ncbi:ACT domain-containing protein [Neisseria gonorrhoeae]|uniref:ACT domain-containing protein n=1 Tax=Neisseria gonorrhoeae TaxID=485 RepID=A0A379B1Q9_NEIGO|nr:ACT domain-containing protein [Neisseria gonorrhoeae]
MIILVDTSKCPKSRQEILDLFAEESKNSRLTSVCKTKKSSKRCTAFESEECDEYPIRRNLETVKMVADQNFDVRTITIGIDLHDCISTDIDVLNQNIYNKITTVGKDLVATAKHLSAKYGVPIVNQRISVTPIAQIAAATKADSYVSVAQTLDKAAKAIGVSFIGGFSALVQKGMSPSDEVLIRSVPEAMKLPISCAAPSISAARVPVSIWMRSSWQAKPSNARLKSRPKVSAAPKSSCSATRWKTIRLWRVRSTARAKRML